MKKYQIIFAITMILPFLVTIVFWFFLPDSIPAHYNALGEIDRWGSKYEMIIIPIASLVMYGFFLLMTKVTKEKQNIKILLITGIIMLIVFLVMTIVFNVKAYLITSNTTYDFNFDIYKIISSLLGIVLIIIAPLMKKAKLNSIFGLRTSYSMKNEKSWQISQLYGCYIMLVSGLIILIGSLFFLSGINCIILLIVILLLDVVLSYIFSKKAYKKSL